MLTILAEESYGAITGISRGLARIPETATIGDKGGSACGTRGAGLIPIVAAIRIVLAYGILAGRIFAGKAILAGQTFVGKAHSTVLAGLCITGTGRRCILARVCTEVTEPPVTEGVVGTFNTCDGAILLGTGREGSRARVGVTGLHTWGRFAVGSLIAIDTGTHVAKIIVGRTAPPI